MTSRAPREFTCKDCGAHVVQIVPLHDNEQDICQTCSWLRSIDDPEERELLRHWLKERGAL